MAVKKIETKVPVLGPEELTPAANKPGEELPELTFLTVFKKGKNYSVLAIKTLGRRVIDQKVVRTSDFRLEALSDLAELQEAVLVGNHNLFVEDK